MKQNTENKIQILKDAIQKGIDGGIAKDFDAEKTPSVFKRQSEKE